MIIVHLPSAQVRRVSGSREGVYHFSQVIKEGATTYYWADAKDCREVNDTPFDRRVAAFVAKMCLRNGKAYA